jgi:hypothetical protein
MSCENTFGETIYAYSRQQAIADGVLIDLSMLDVIKRHWKYPFACTSAVWAIIEEAREMPGQDLPGICHDIAVMAKIAIHNPHGVRDADQIRFEVLITGKKHALKLHIGPGDTAAPVLTLMLPYED